VHINRLTRTQQLSLIESVAHPFEKQLAASLEQNQSLFVMTDSHWAIIIRTDQTKSI
jgi:hypothetical protein